MFIVRPFEGRDAQRLADLMMEMARFYGAVVAPALVVADDLLRQAKDVDIIVAADDCEILGFVTFGALYPVAGLVPFLYVQQIYVGSNARRLGVAQQLMSAVAGAAKARGISRVEWSTGSENVSAQTFYAQLGAHSSAKMYYVLDGTALERLQGGADSA